MKKSKNHWGVTIQVPSCHCGMKSDKCSIAKKINRNKKEFDNESDNETAVERCDNEDGMGKEVDWIELSSSEDEELCCVGSSKKARFISDSVTERQSDDSIDTFSNEEISTKTVMAIGFYGKSERRLGYGYITELHYFLRRLRSWYSLLGSVSSVSNFDWHPMSQTSFL